MLKTNATNASMEKAVPKSRKNKTINDHINAPVGRPKEVLQENSRNNLDRKTNIMQKNNETKVWKEMKKKLCLLLALSV